MTVARCTIVAAFLAVPSAAVAQSSILTPYVYVPWSFATAPASDSSGKPLSKPDSTVLQWACGDSTEHPTLRAGRQVTRQVTVGGTVFTYAETLQAAVWIPTLPTNAPRAIHHIKATVSVNKDKPDVIRVNPWRFKDSAIVLTSGADTLRMRRDDFARCSFSYKLANRVSVDFPLRGWTVGASVIPFRIRRGYTADNAARTRIDGDVSTSLNVGLYGGRTWGKKEYLYAEDGENTMRDVLRFTVGTFLAFSTASADAASTRSASAPLPADRKVSFLTASPGAMAMLNIRGVDVGVFGAPEYVLGSRDARKWDRNKKIWWGFGLGYQLLK